MSDLQAELEELLGIAEWSWLAEHAIEGRLLIVAPNLELLSVGLALAEDNVSIVKQWLDDGWVYRPTEAQIEHWTTQNIQGFTSLIVQPFVLAQAPVINKDSIDPNRDRSE